MASSVWLAKQYPTSCNFHFLHQTETQHKKDGHLFSQNIHIGTSHVCLNSPSYTFLFYKSKGKNKKGNWVYRRFNIINIGWQSKNNKSIGHRCDFDRIMSMIIRGKKHHGALFRRLGYLNERQLLIDYLQSKLNHNRRMATHRK